MQKAPVRAVQFTHVVARSPCADKGGAVILNDRVDLVAHRFFGCRPTCIERNRAGRRHPGLIAPLGNVGLVERAAALPVRNLDCRGGTRCPNHVSQPLVTPRFDYVK